MAKRKPPPPQFGGNVMTMVNVAKALPAAAKTICEMLGAPTDEVSVAMALMSGLCWHVGTKLPNEARVAFVADLDMRLMAGISAAAFDVEPEPPRGRTPRSKA